MVGENTTFIPTLIRSHNEVWNPDTLAWEVMTQPVINTDELTVAGSMSVTNFPETQGVTGTFWPDTQPVSIAEMPSTPVTGAFYPATQPVSGIFYQETQPVSAAALPLPSGAATLAEQTVLESLIDTLQELTARLTVLSGWDSSGITGCRVIGTGGSYAVTGPQTSAQFIAAFLTSRGALEELASQENISKVTV